MVIEIKSLIKERVIAKEWDLEFYNERINDAIWIVDKYYNFTTPKIRNTTLLRNGFINDNSIHQYHTCVQAKNITDTNKYLIQIVDDGEILFSEIYVGTIPTKKELIAELEELKK